MKFRTYKQTQKWAKENEIKTSLQWYQWMKSNKKPKDIPSHPYRQYKEWINWSEFFGRKTRKNAKGFLSYEEAVNINKKLKIRTPREYKEYVINNPECLLPKAPNYFYEKEWSGWSDFLFDKYVSLDEIIDIIIKEDIKNWRDWVEFSKTKRPAGVPSDIFRTYTITIKKLMEKVKEKKKGD